MCGVAGIFHYREPARPVDAELLAAMTRSLAHRGPDGQGIWTAPGIGLGHRRLAIIDLSPNARQPMADPSGRLHITFNGEIYNFRELRQELATQGLPARTQSDTEIILLGYQAWGERVLERLSGIFAFALWDAAKKQLLLARDPLGVKPLFFSDQGGTLRFGSEIKAILTDPAVDRDMDLAALDAFLTFNYTPAPRTGFLQVRQLLPAQCAAIHSDGMRLWTYWKPPFAETPAATPFPEALAQFDDCLDRVTKAQMVSDVPLGAFLSGGIDSAAIVRAMKRARLTEVHTLNVGFDVRGFDEHERAKDTAARLGVSFSSQQISLQATDLLPQLSLHVEEPTADSSMLPVYLLCKAARTRFTVAMSGDGADEILAGYETYRATRWAARYRLLPAWFRRVVCRPLAQALPVSAGKYSWHQVATRFTAGAEFGPGQDHAAWRMVFSPELKQRLYTPDFARQVQDCDPLSEYAAPLREVPSQRESLLGLLHMDTTFYLPNDMLVKVDRMSMANSLEVRVPFLDVEMVGLAANLPPEFKLASGKKRKHILRESLRRDLPASTLDAPKSGFNIPVESWMRGPLRDLLLDQVRAQRDDLSGLLRLEELETVVEEHHTRRAEHAHALFGVLMLALWLNNRTHAWRGVRHQE